MTVHVFHTFPGSINRWRPYEREELARRFGPVAEHGISDGLRLYQPGDICYWKLHAERTAQDDLARAIREAVIQFDAGCKSINDPRTFMAAHAKEEAFEYWEQNGVACPEWQQLDSERDVTKAADLGYPQLIRINDSVTGEHSCLVEDADQAMVAFRRLVVFGMKDMVIRWGPGIGRRIIAVAFHETATKEFPHRTSYRIIVAGNRVITGYARLAEPPDWVAIAGKFRPDMADAWLEANTNCQEYMTDHGDEVVRVVRAVGLTFVGVDVLPLSDGRHLMLEVQPDFSCGNMRPVGDAAALAKPLMWHESLFTCADGGLDLRAGFSRPAPEDSGPPFYNPSHPALVKFLLGNMAEVRRRCPLYANVFLDKQVLFRECWAAVAERIGA